MRVAPRLVPELICTDLARSVAFYGDLLGFAVRYARPGERYAYLARDGAELMLEQPHDRARLHPRAELVHPFGRGINLEVDVDDVDAIHRAVRGAGLDLYLELEERWYARAQDSVLVRQFAVQDPDGYLLRLSQMLRTRPDPGLRTPPR